MSKQGPAQALCNYQRYAECHERHGERCRDREDDDKAAQIAHAYGAVFAEVLYCDLPEWALQELSCS